MTEQELDELYDEIKGEDMVKEADVGVEELIEELEKTAEEFSKEASEADIRKIRDHGVIGELEVRSNSPSKQRLKEIALQGTKGEDKSGLYPQLRKLVFEKHASLIDDLAEKIVAEIGG